MTKPAIKLLHIDKITLLPEELQTRHNKDVHLQTVEEYAEDMLKGDVFPPVTVFWDGTKFLLASGHHRIAAYRHASIGSVPVEIYEGDLDDAFQFALKQNRTHGLRYTNADKREAVEMALRRYPEFSDRTIGELAGVTHPTVAKVRREAAGQGKPKTKKEGASKAAADVSIVIDPPSPDRKEVEKFTTHDAPDPGEFRPPIDDSNEDPVAILSEENDRLMVRIAALAGGEIPTDEERTAAHQYFEQMRAQLKASLGQNVSLAAMRDHLMNENSELKREVKRLRKKLDQQQRGMA